MGLSGTRPILPGIKLIAHLLRQGHLIALLEGEFYATARIGLQVVTINALLAKASSKAA